MRYLRFIFLSIVFAMTVAVFPSAAQDTRSQESRKARLEREIQIINKQLKENASQSSSALSSLTLIRKKIANRNELIAESDREIGELTLWIEAKQNEISAIQRRLDTLSDYYAKLVRNAYKNRDSKVWYMYILASDNLGQAFRRIGYLRNLSVQMNSQAKKIGRAKEELEAETSKLDELLSQARALRTQRQGEINSLHQEEAQSQTVINQLTRDRRKYEQNLAAKKKQVEALNREIERIIREAAREAEKAAAGSKTSGGNAASDKSAKTGSSRPKAAIDYTLDAEFAKNKGKLPWPAEGPLVEKFGQHNHPVYTRVKMPFNNGITIALGQGTGVKAIFDGVVKQIVVMPGYNRCVLVQHGNYFSFYCKLGSVSVKAGDKVKTGQTIGVVDTIDGQTELHLQIWKGTAPQNPELWLRP